MEIQEITINVHAFSEIAQCSTELLYFLDFHKRSCAKFLLQVSLLFWLIGNFLLNIAFLIFTIINELLSS